MRRSLVLALLLLVGAAAATPALRHAPASAQPEFHLALPVAVDRFDLDALPPPPAPPTDEPPPTEVPPTATLDIPPTITPEPTWTPEPEEGGVVTGRLLAGGQPVPEGTGGSYPGPGLFLRLCQGNEGNCQVLARTGADAEGRYRFVVSTSPGPGEFMQVAWWNEHGMLGDHELSADERYLGVWFGPRIRELSSSVSVDMPDFEVGDFALLSPTHGTGFQGLPIQFVWEAWTGPVDKYSWSICKCCQSLEQRLGAYKKPVGTSTQYELDSQPPGTRIDPNERYCWFVQVDSTGGRGIGYNRQARMLWFFLQALAPLGVDAGAWTGDLRHAPTPSSARLAGLGRVPW